MHQTKFDTVLKLNLRALMEGKIISQFYSPHLHVLVSFLTIAVCVRASLQGVNESHGCLRTPLPSAESMTVRDRPSLPETSCK